MAETFAIDCQGCGETKSLITTHHGTIGIHRSRGVTSTVDIEVQEIGDWWER